ncbi:MAG: hypothetical protein WBA76_16705 [Phormidesmis sp.]
MPTKEPITPHGAKKKRKKTPGIRQKSESKRLIRVHLPPISSAFCLPIRAKNLAVGSTVKTVIKTVVKTVWSKHDFPDFHVIMIRINRFMPSFMRSGDSDRREILLFI